MAPPYKGLLGSWKMLANSGNSNAQNQNNPSQTNQNTQNDGENKILNHTNQPSFSSSATFHSGLTAAASSLSVSAPEPLPSNASIASARPSTVSTYQSSVFSRNAASVSTGSSSRYGNPYFPDPISENDDDSPSSSGKPMKILDPVAMSSLTDADIITTAVARPQLQSPTPAQTAPQTRIPNSIRASSYMPEVPIPGSSPNRLFFSASPGARSSSVSSSSSLSRYLRGPPPASLQTSGTQGQPVSAPPIQPPHSPQAAPSLNSFQGSSSTPTAASASSVVVPPFDLSLLADDLYSLLDQVNAGSLDVGRAASLATQFMRSAAAHPALDNVADDQYSLHSDSSISRIIKVVLHFHDTLLRHSQMQPTKMYILRALYQLGVRLKLISPTVGTVPFPQNFAIGSIAELPGQEILVSLLDTVAGQSDSGIAEQQGAYIAPVLRGLAPEFSVLTLSFGFPKPDVSHFELVAGMYDISSDIHIYCHKNYIRVCGSSGFKAPYRIPEDANNPPMSVSLSAETATTLSGTLGGYIYPRVNPNEPELADYGRSTFAMTCAHVCLSENNGTNYPNVSIPSPVLVGLYRKALNTERNKYPTGSIERQEYDKVINLVEDQYKKNKPAESFGQVAWGERTVVDGRISDLAIIKCNTKLQCRNFLGDDVAFSEYDPALMFGNLYVKRIIRKLMPGMNVFKYGSTSKYTKGKVNGPRLVYWSDGKIQSSEFVVNSESPIFASGGDSGAWILQKSEYEHVGSNNDSGSNHSAGSASGPCLGVVGMLHSYDGERKELGLFTPISAILERLYDVTHIQWGVVGVPEENDEVPAGGSDSDPSEQDDSSEGEQS